MTKYRTATIIFKVTGEDILLTTKQRRQTHRPGDSIVHGTRCTSASLARVLEHDPRPLEIKCPVITLTTEVPSAVVRPKHAHLYRCTRTSRSERRGLSDRSVVSRSPVSA